MWNIFRLAIVQTLLELSVNPLLRIHEVSDKQGATVMIVIWCLKFTSLFFRHLFIPYALPDASASAAIVVTVTELLNDERLSKENNKQKLWSYGLTGWIDCVWCPSLPRSQCHSESFQQIYSPTHREMPKTSRRSSTRESEK